MRTSDTTSEVSTALAAFQASTQTVERDGTGNYGTYSTLAASVRAASAELSKNGLSVSQWIEWDGSEDLLTTRLNHSSGEWQEATMRLHLVKDDPQGQGSATTYARRYSYLAALGLAPSDDDDGEAATQAVRAKPKVVKTSPEGRIIKGVKWAAKCSVCQAAVEVGTGGVQNTNGEWIPFCDEHLPGAPAKQSAPTTDGWADNEEPF